MVSRSNETVKIGYIPESEFSNTTIVAGKGGPFPPFDNPLDMPSPNEEVATSVNDIVHSSSGGSVTEINGNTSFVEILKKMQLFDTVTLDLQMDDIEERACLLQSQLSKRTPQLLPPRLKPSSRPLPSTDGVTLVEQLIELGEYCHWTTQKSEHVWFYERALQEHLYKTLLQVEPLFDMATLTNLFENTDRNKGARICSCALMDEIVVMVNQMTKMAEYPGGTQKKITFDAVKILSPQYKQKF